MPHNFKRFPELTNSQMALYYFDSPHKQIFESFKARVVDVHDGDTIKVSWQERDFDFPIRFANIAAPELNENGGLASQKWLSKEILGEEVQIIINPNNRVGKWGRLIGEIIHGGISINMQSVDAGYSVKWKDRGQIKWY